MDQTIVRNDVRDREDPVVPGLGQHVRPGAGQGPLRRDQSFVYAVHPLDDPAGPGQVQLGHRRARQDAGLRAGRHQRAHRRRVQLHVGVEVDARERRAGRVAQPQRVRLARCRRLDDAYAVHLHGNGGGVVGAGVRDHDDVELTGGGAVEQPAQVGRDDRFLVVRRYDDADYGLGHAGQDSRYPGRTSR
jgi:hypothetical protein